MPATQATRWCGTAWLDDAPVPVIPSRVRFYCWAPEICPDTGRKHIQLYFEVFKKTTLSGALGLFDQTGASMHLDVARGSADENISYIKGPWTSADGAKHKPLNPDYNETGKPSVGKGNRSDLDAVQQAIDNGSSYDDVTESHFSVVARCSRFVSEYTKARDRKKARREAEEVFSSVVLRDWQNKYCDILLAEVDNRAVYWVYDYAGNTGKSFFISYMCAQHGALALSPARVLDMSYVYDMQKIVLIDLSRTSAPSEERNHALDSVYSFIEMLKNGRIFSPKYESVTKVFKPPHVLVTANFPPDKNKLSEDRWRIEELN